MGVPVSDVRVKVVRARPEPWVLGPGGWGELELPVEEAGEVVVSGDHVQKGYINDPQAVRANKVLDADGVVWHRTGDLGYLDARGRLWLVGRVNSAIPTSSGGHLYPIKVEALVEGLAGVRRAALVRVRERVGVAVELDEGATAPELGAVQKVARAPELQAVWVVGSIPVDPRHNAKIDVPVLRRLLEGGAE